MVARHFGVVEAVGSNPATQTSKSRLFSLLFYIIPIFYLFTLVFAII